jgi:hypothetical protein
VKWQFEGFWFVIGWNDCSVEVVGDEAVPLSLKFAIKALLAQCSLLQVLLVAGAEVLLVDLPLA